MNAATADYEISVFVNCPYDEKYVPLLRAMLFVLCRFGLKARLSSERLVSNEYRLDKICEIIPQCRYSIHDLSRLSPLPAESARMNMPFELGIDWGWNRYGRAADVPPKVFLILEEHSGGIRRALSDIGGGDFGIHKGDPRSMVGAIRNFFYEKATPVRARSHIEHLWTEFNLFTSSLQLIDRESKQVRPTQDIDGMPVAEYLDLAVNWINSACAK